MSQRFNRRVCHARSALIWGAAFLFLAQVGLTTALHHGPPRWRDPEYGRRLDALRQRVAQHPQRPLTLVLGSSRVGFGIRPSAWEAMVNSTDSAPLLFNVGMVGAGPVLELVTLQRLLADGIRPRRVVLEVWPPFCRQDSRFAEQARFQDGRIDPKDVAILRRYFADRDRLEDRWQVSWLVPWYGRRFLLLNQLLPTWLPAHCRPDIGWRGLDGWGWLTTGRPGTASERPLRIEKTRQQLQPYLEQYEFHPASRQALREMVALCRRHDISLLLLWLPESSEFRSWYPSATLTTFQEELLALEREFGVPCLNARDWAVDEDITDGYHLTPEGAARFSQWLGQVLRDRP